MPEIASPKLYGSLEALVGDVERLNWDAALYVSHPEWEETPEQTSILYLHADDEEFANPDDDVPLLAADRNMRGLFDVQTFQDIIQVQREQQPQSTTGDFVRAINYYRSHDSFLKCA